MTLIRSEAESRIVNTKARVMENFGSLSTEMNSYKKTLMHCISSIINRRSQETFWHSSRGILADYQSNHLLKINKQKLTKS